MAQPSQEFPPWLTPIASVITDDTGALTTSTTISYIAPTYFGPSIPLGTLYSFGGFAEPPTVVLPGGPAPTIATSITTTATPAPTTAPPTTTVTPTTSLTTTATSTSITTTTSIVSLSTSLTSSSSTASLTSSTTTSNASSITSALTSSSSFISSSFTSSATSSSSAPSSTGGPASTAGLTKGQLVGVIVASILGLVFLFVLALFLFLCCKGRRGRRGSRTLLPLDDDYFIVPPGGRTPGDGSPRHSGEEADPFLQRRAETSAAGGAAAMSQTAGGAAASRPARVPPPTTGSNGSDSSNSNASGFGVLLDRPSLGYLPSMPEHPTSGGRPLSAAEMERLDHENVLPDDHEHYDDGEYSGAYAYDKEALARPPRLVDPAAAPLLGTIRPPFDHQNSYLSKQSSFHDHDESATLLTARRVKVGDLARSAPQTPNDSPSGPSGGLLAAIGLGGLRELGRRSWFKTFDSPRSSIVVSPSYEAAPISDKDIETGRSMLSPDHAAVDSFGNRTRGVGIGPNGSRPMSGASGRSDASGGTLYHDAESALLGTPLIAPPPRALTPAEHPFSEHSWFSSPLAHPPAYDDQPFIIGTSTPRTPSPAHSNRSFSTVPTGIDILDMPAPAAINHFSSISSLKQTATGSSVGMKATPFPPPGLDTIRPVGWSDTATDVTASHGSFGMASGLDAQDTGISFDVLEDAPPDAEHGWRRMASSAGTGSGDAVRRGTFGVYVPGADLTSEQGSLHSMRSHFSPSVRSTGSAAASRFEVGSINSNSSRPSAHSNSRSISSGVASIARTNSISSDSQQRRYGGAIPPALSAFGLRGHSGQTRAAAGSAQQQSQQSMGYDVPMLPPVLDSPPSAHMNSNKLGTVRNMASGDAMLGDTSMSTVRAGSSSPLSSNSFLPWAGGLGDNWQPSP